MTSPAQGFDVNDLSQESAPITHKVSVIDDEDGNPVSGFVIVGKNSKEYQNASNAIRIDNIKRAAKRKTQVDTGTDAGAAIVARTVASNDRTTALSVVIDWFGMLSNGQPMPFDKAVVEKMLDKFPQWQVRILNDLDNDANFTKA